MPKKEYLNNFIIFKPWPQTLDPKNHVRQTHGHRHLFIYTEDDLTHGGEEGGKDQQHHEDAGVADAAHAS